MRVIYELHNAEAGLQTVLVRIPFGTSSQVAGSVEITALVRVPAIDSEAQVEAAAREMAKLALQEVVSKLP